MLPWVVERICTDDLFLIVEISGKHEQGCTDLNSLVKCLQRPVQHGHRNSSQVGALIASACHSSVDQALHEVLDIGTAPIALCMHCCIENCADIVAVRCEQCSMLGCMIQ